MKVLRMWEKMRPSTRGRYQLVNTEREVMMLTVDVTSGASDCVSESGSDSISPESVAISAQFPPDDRRDLPAIDANGETPSKSAASSRPMSIAQILSLTQSVISF